MANTSPPCLGSPWYVGCPAALCIAAFRVLMQVSAYLLSLPPNLQPPPTWAVSSLTGEGRVSLSFLHPFMHPAPAMYQALGWV